MNKKEKNDNVPMSGEDIYKWHRDKVAELIEDEQYLFDSVDEAITLYRPAWEDEKLGKALSEDRELTRLMLAQKIKERAKVRRHVVKAAKEGNDKAAKLALNTLSETTEWAKLNGKPWGSLALIGDGNDDGRVAVTTLETESTERIIKELDKRKKAAKALLADTAAQDVKEEEPEEDDDNDKIEFEE